MPVSISEAARQAEALEHVRLEQVQTIGGASGLGADLLRFRPVSSRVLSPLSLFSLAR